MSLSNVQFVIYLYTGTATQVPCPPGTYSNDTQQSDVAGCTACPGGYYCAGNIVGPFKTSLFVETSFQIAQYDLKLS